MKRPSISLSALLFLLCLAFLCCWGGLKSRAVAADDPLPPSQEDVAQSAGEVTPSPVHRTPQANRSTQG